MRMTTLADIAAQEEKQSYGEWLGPYQNTYEVLAAAVARHAKQPAFIFLPEGKPMPDAPTLTYEQIFALVNQYANFLRAAVTTATPVISYLLPNIPENYCLLQAAETVGIANPIAPMLPPDIIAKLLQNAKSDLLVTAAPLLNLVLAVRNIYQTQTKKILPIYVMGGQTDEKNQVYSFEESLKTYTAKHPKATQQLLFQRKITHKDVCAYFHTSGTTGMPKLAPLTHGGKIYTLRCVETRLDYRVGDRILMGLPMFHVAAPMIGGLAAFNAGATVVIMSPFGWMHPNVVANFRQIVAEYSGKRAHTASLPIFYYQLLAQPQEHDVTALRYAISGTAMEANKCLEFNKAFPRAEVIDMYGCTESTCWAFLNPLNNGKPGSMGLRLPYSETRVVKLEKGNYVDCQPGERGFLWLKGPHIITQYQQTKQPDDVFPQAGWFNTRDIVVQDKDGYFSMICRAEEQLYFRGKYCSALETENILLKNAAIDMAAVVGRPNENGEEIPVAYVKLQGEAKISDADLQNWAAQQQYPNQMPPAQIIVVKQFELNGMGKIQKTILAFEQIQTALDEYLQKQLGADYGSVAVRPDEVYRKVAMIQLAEHYADKIGMLEKALAAFSIHFQIACKVAADNEDAAAVVAASLRR